MLGALSRAGIILDHKEALAAAQKNFAFVKAKLWMPPPRPLYHRWRDGERDSAQLLSGLRVLSERLHRSLQRLPSIRRCSSSVSRCRRGIIEKFLRCQRRRILHEHGFEGSPVPGQGRLRQCRTLGEFRGDSGPAAAGKDHRNEDLRAKAEASLLAFHKRLEEVPQAVPLMLKAAAFAEREPFRRRHRRRPGRRPVLCCGPRTVFISRIGSSSEPPDRSMNSQGDSLHAMASHRPTSAPAKPGQPPTHDPVEVRRNLTDKKEKSGK